MRLWSRAQQAEICFRHPSLRTRRRTPALPVGRRRGSRDLTRYRPTEGCGFGWHDIRVPSWLPLLAVLVVQAVLSVRLVGADTAFQDEGTYLWAGHLEWAHVLHGTPLPPFASYFSGAPVIYPPLGALADSVGGLAGARLLSLVFMLASTALGWDVTRRLFGRRAAFFAAALFAVLGSTLHLGAFATYDAMSLFLLALATWLVAGAGERGGSDRPDGRGRGDPGAGQRHGLLHRPVRPCGDRAGGLRRVASWAAGGGPPRRHPAGRYCRAADRWPADRREHLPDRDHADHAGASAGQRPLADRAAARLVLDRDRHRAGAVRRVQQLVPPARTGAAPGCLRCWPLPRCSGRSSRPSCTPPIR